MRLCGYCGPQPGSGEQRGFVGAVAAHGQEEESMPALRVAEAGHSQGSAVSSSHLQQEMDRGEAL